jgi:hypothetical protein
MKVLVACEFSGIVRDAFAVCGHDAWSCDLLPTERRGQHIQGDVLEVLGNGWDLMVAHPPCTHLAASGARWFKIKRKDGRQQEGIDFFMALADAPIPRKAVENPIGIMSKIHRKPDQIVHPYQFGHEVQKATCLWLTGLPLLVPTNIVGRGMIYVDPRGHKHGGEHTMRAKRGYSPLMLLPRNEERWKIRSRTFQGIASAMAEQWGGITAMTGGPLLAEAKP